MRRLSMILLAGGVVAGLLGALGLAIGAWVNLPPRAVRTIALSLPFVVAFLLLVVGAVVGRMARGGPVMHDPAGSARDRERERR